MAGGKGSRLYPLTQNTPKPLLPVNNIPNIVKILAEVNRCKIKKAVITTGYLGDELKKNIGSSIYDVEIKYAHEENPLGSAGGVKNASKYTSGDLLVISGDAVFEGDLSDMIKRHYGSNADLTVACTEMEDTSRFGVLVTDKNGSAEFRGFYGDYSAVISSSEEVIGTKISLSKTSENNFEISL
jgi:mannose-1-phosphate guanylyltransferase/phosphomannomutase